MFRLQKYCRDYLFKYQEDPLGALLAQGIAYQIEINKAIIMCENV